MLKLTDELEAAQKCVEATDKLIQLIDTLVRQLKAVPPEEYQGNADRARSIALQTAIGEFFGSLGCKDIEREFFRFTTELDELDSDIVSQRFRPTARRGRKTRKGRKPDHFRLWFVRGSVAAALQCFLHAKDQEKSAARRIVKHRKELEALSRTGTKNIQDAAFNWLRLFKDKAVGSPENSGWQGCLEIIKRFETKMPSAEDWIGLGNDFLKTACNVAVRLI
ncbi:MAG: hypothetical protein WA728_14070 [Xanthobacteraceae bacterium]